MPEGPVRTLLSWFGVALVGELPARSLWNYCANRL